MTDQPDSETLIAQRAATWRERHGAGRKPTINDVAAVSGMSKKTVSRVINAAASVREETRARVDLAIGALGFSPDPQARGLAFRHSFLIGLIYDNPNPQYVVNMQEGLLEGLAGTEFELAVHRCDRSAPDFLSNARRFVERQKLFGVILVPSVSEDERLVAVLRELGCAFMRVASVSLDERSRMIVSHDRIGGRRAAEYLVGLGHTRIGHVTGLAGFRSAAERRAGFEEGLAVAGLSLAPHDVFEGRYTIESGVEAGERLFSRVDRPTAVFAANDQMAVGVLHAARRRDVVVPRDLSVIGYDDLQSAGITWPPLTTIHSPVRETGKLAINKLLASRFGDPSKAPDETEPWLVVRESAGPPPGGG